MSGFQDLLTKYIRGAPKNIAKTYKMNVTLYN